MDVDAQPVGESHFANPTPMTVERGSSAMVSMVRAGDRRRGRVPLRRRERARQRELRVPRGAVQEPDDSTLETGPVTVYGNEQFIGEGLTEPIPPKASAVVPYALDRQIVVERNDRRGEQALAARHAPARRPHRRGPAHPPPEDDDHEPAAASSAKVYIRHTVNKGWTLLEAPPAFERVGDAHLFEVHLKPSETKDVEIAEATPIERTLDLNADVTLDMMKVYVEAPEGSPELKEQPQEAARDPQEARSTSTRSRQSLRPPPRATTASAWTSCTRRSSRCRR